MKAYFSIVDNIPDWNIVLPPLKKIGDPENQKLVLILKELKYLTIYFLICLR